MYIIILLTFCATVGCQAIEPNKAPEDKGKISAPSRTPFMLSLAGVSSSSTPISKKSVGGPTGSTASVHSSSSSSIGSMGRSLFDIEVESPAAKRPRTEKTITPQEVHPAAALLQASSSSSAAPIITTEHKRLSQEKVSELLKKKKLKWIHLANKVGLTPKQMYHLRDGSTKLSPAMAQKIATELGTNVQEIYASDESPTVSAYRIDELLKEKGWSGGELARQTGNAISQSYINKLRTGASGDPKLETLQTIAQALGVELHELYKPAAALLQASSSSSAAPIITTEHKRLSREKVSELLKKKKLKWIHLANKVGLTPNQMYELRNGRIKLSPEMAQKIATELGTNVQEIYASDESPTVSAYRIDELLKEKGWSGGELARQTGNAISSAQINRLRSGISANPKLETLQSIAQAFNVSLQDLFVNPDEYAEYMEEMRQYL